MKTNPFTCSFLIALLVTACAPTPPPHSSKPDLRSGNYVLERSNEHFTPAQGQAGASDIARFLAGKPVRSGASLSQLQQSGDYQTYAGEMDHKWRNYAGPRILRQQNWSRSNISSVIGSPGTVLYPFGGPDLLHAVAMFPDSSNYVLLGLEPVGSVPSLESIQSSTVLGALPQFARSMDVELKIGYFITQEMRSNLTQATLHGVTPILLATIGLLDGQVHSVNSISAGGRSGVEIRFSIPGGGSKRVTYVSGDLSNGGFAGGYRSWVASNGGSVAYFKAASYLTHGDSFSAIRNHILSNCRAVLQDDSGIPYRHFDAAKWDSRLFGRYDSPIELFAKHRQADLQAAYNNSGGIPGINFGSGYHVRGSIANLQLYVRK